MGELPTHPTNTYPTRPIEAITTITIHHAASNSTPQQMASYHVNTRGWPGIGYHYVVMADGTIYQTNYHTTKSYHAGSYNAPGDENYWSLAVCLSGNFQEQPPPQRQLDAARVLVGWLFNQLPGVNGGADVVRHKDMPGAQTACPGNTSPQWFDYVANR